MPIFYAHKRPDGLIYERPALYQAYIAGLKPDARYEVTVKRYRPKRTDKQSRYYFGVVVAMIADETGMTKDQAHDALRQKFLTVPGDGPLKVIRSTTELTTVEMVEYTNQCVLFAAEFLGVIVPPPEWRDE